MIHSHGSKFNTNKHREDFHPTPVPSPQSYSQEKLMSIIVVYLLDKFCEYSGVYVCIFFKFAANS